MKRSLLATVAAVAMIAGTGWVSAEGVKEQQAPKAGAAETHKGAAGGAAEMKGSAQHRDSAATTGSGAERNASEGRGSAAGKADKGTADNKAMNGNRPSTTGSGAAESGKADSRSSQGTRSQTTGQGASEQRSPSGAEPRSRSERQNQPGATQTQREQRQPNAAQGRNESNTTVQGQAGGQGGQAGASVNLTQEQRTKIRTTVIQSNSAPKISRSDVRFDVRVGTVVPRTVKFVAVPPTLVEIHPQWRGYRYFIVDEEIVIVDPNTLRIVAVLDV